MLATGLASGLLAVCLWGLGAAASAQAQEVAIAQVKTMTGTVMLVRGSSELNARIGSDIYIKDVVRTSADGSLGISFLDNSSISLGGNSELKMEDFKYEPARDELSFWARLFRGTMVYVSGLIAKLSPEDVKISTPVATVTVRGTKMAVRAK